MYEDLETDTYLIGELASELIGQVAPKNSPVKYIRFFINILPFKWKGDKLNDLAQQ